MTFLKEIWANVGYVTATNVCRKGWLDMNRYSFIGIIVFVAAAFVHQIAAQNSGGSKVQMVLQEEMFSIPGKEAAIQRAIYPAGWAGERHYHTGDIFVYVLEGQFIVDLDNGKRITIDEGEVYHEAVNQVMRARNGSAERDVTVLLFQVGDKGKPRVILAD